MIAVKSKTKKVEIKEKTAKKEPAGLGSEKNTTSPQPSPQLRRGGDNLDAVVYNQEGQEVSSVSLPAEIFGLKMRMDLVSQAVRAQMANSRQSIAHSKDRSEVRGGGKKPWKQKGTGRARHASIRSPLWAGGGVTFGPRNEKNFTRKINKKMKRRALFMVLSGKLRDGELIILDDLKLKQTKTKAMAEIMKNIFGALALARDNSPTKVGTPSAMIVLPKNDESVVRAAKNLPRILTMGVGSLNVVDLLSVRYLLMPKEAIDEIRKIYLK